jgi:heat shock protein HslJ
MAVRATVAALGLATIGLAGVTLGACGDDSDDTSGTVSSAPVTTSGSTPASLDGRELAEPKLPLEGTTWTLEGIIADDAAATVPTGVVATIRIVDGEAQVDTSCNTGFAVADVRDDSIVFGPLALTKKACPPEQTEVERLMVATLMGEVGYGIESDVLTLTTGTRGLSFRGVAG